jgi:hypothetical protein
LPNAAKNAARQGDILGFDIDIGSLCKTAHDGEQGLSRQERRFVSQGIVNLSIHTNIKNRKKGIEEIPQMV